MATEAKRIRDTYIEHGIGIPEELDPEGLDLDENHALVAAGLMTVKQVENLVAILKDEESRKYYAVEGDRNFSDVKKNVIDLAIGSEIKGYEKRGKDGKTVRQKIYALIDIFEKRRKEPLVLGKTAEKTMPAPEIVAEEEDEDSSPPPEAPPAALSFEERVRAQTAREIEKIQQQMRQEFEGGGENESEEMASAEAIANELGGFTAGLVEAEIAQNEIKKTALDLKEKSEMAIKMQANIAALSADISVAKEQFEIATKRREMTEIAEKMRVAITELDLSLRTAQDAKIKADEVVNQHRATIQGKMQQQGKGIQFLQTSVSEFQEKSVRIAQDAVQTALREQQKAQNELAVFAQGWAHQETSLEAKTVMGRIINGYASKAQSWKKIEGAMSAFSKIVQKKVTEYEKLSKLISPFITAEVGNSEEVSEEDDSARAVAHEESDLKNAETPEAIDTADPVIEKLNRMAIPTEIPPVKTVETNEDLMKFVQTQQELMNEMQRTHDARMREMKKTIEELSTPKGKGRKKKSDVPPTPPVDGDHEDIAEDEKKANIAILHSEKEFKKLFQNVKIDSQIIAEKNRVWEALKAANTIYGAFQKIDGLEDLLAGTRRDFKTEFQLDQNGHIIFKAFFDGENRLNRDGLDITFLQDNILFIQTFLREGENRNLESTIKQNSNSLATIIKDSQVFQPEALADVA